MDNAASGGPERTRVGLDAIRRPRPHGNRRGQDHRALAWTIIGREWSAERSAVTLGFDGTAVGVAAVGVLAAMATWVRDPRTGGRVALASGRAGSSRSTCTTADPARPFV